MDDSPEILFLDRDPGGIDAQFGYRDSMGFRGTCLPGEGDLIERLWEKRPEGRYNGALATLWHADPPRYDYIETDYMTYHALAGHPGEFEGVPRERLRISSVGGAVITGDGKVCVQERPEGYLAAGLWDSAAAGFCTVSDGKLDFEAAIRSKLERELGLGARDLESITPTAVFSSSDYCSGMVGYKVHTQHTFHEVQGRRRDSGELYAVELQDLSCFIVDTYAGKRRLIGDGCAVLLSILPDQEFRAAVGSINRLGRPVAQGVIEEGRCSIRDCLS
jgi:hypothetical protein